MTLTWAAGAFIVLIASFVQGLAGFGIGLVALAFLPFLMSPVTAVVLMTVYATVFTLVIFVPLRRDVRPWDVSVLLLGTIAGVPCGVWGLATFRVSTLNRMIGLVLVVVALLDLRGLFPQRLQGRRWALGSGFAAGVLGGAVGTPGPPIVLYATTQGWSPRTIKANVQAFLAVNQAVTLSAYWWTGLISSDVLRFSAILALPALAGVLAGMALFSRIDQVRFRRVVFALLFVSGVTLLVRG